MFLTEGNKCEHFHMFTHFGPDIKIHTGRGIGILRPPVHCLDQDASSTPLSTSLKFALHAVFFLSHILPRLDTGMPFCADLA